MEAVIMKKIKIEFTNERIIPASGLAVVGAILGKSDLDFSPWGNLLMSPSMSLMTTRIFTNTHLALSEAYP